MVPRRRDNVTDRVRARRALHAELARLRAVPPRYGGYWPTGCRWFGPSRLVVANAAILRLKPYRHHLDWSAAIAAVVDLLGDELADDVARWIIEEAA